MLLLITAPSVFAAAPADENYDDDPGATFTSQNTFTLDGVKYTITGSGSYSHQTSNNSLFSPLGNDAGDYFLLLDSGGAYGVSSIKIEAADGSYFRLNGASIDAIADAAVTITPYDGVTAGTAISRNSNGLFFAETLDLSANTSFQYVTSVVFSGGNLSISLDDLDFESAVPPPPTVTPGNISISGASGTAGAYKIGDTVSATWNNTAGGDNNSATITGVTVDFTQFGGGAAVAATNSTGTWTATYTIVAGSIDLTARNVSVSATSSGGTTTTADTANATVDNVAPTVTDAKISISGATGTAGAYKIGDTVTATWNNTVGGDNNTDTISSVKVNFSAFDGGTAVTATNSAGTWTATYTIVAGSTDLNNRNVSVTATDNAGNTTATGDTTNATLDNVAPAVSSIAVSGSPVSTDTSMAFTVTFNDTVSNISTDDFTLVGTGTASGTIVSVSAASGTSVDVNIAVITGVGTLKVNLNGSTNIVDNAGNTPPAAYTSGSTHTVAIPTAPGAPTIGTATAGDGQANVTFTAPGSNGGSAITTYTATANPGGAVGSCAGPSACTATVSGLINGTAYTFTVKATNAIGEGAASGASNSVTPKGAQTITFANPGTQSFGTTPTLGATATSALTVTFTSSTTGVCTITSGGDLTFVTAGSCTINADQAGTTAWNAATTVPQTFTVNAVVPSAPTIGTATAGDTQATVTFTAPASTGGAAIIASGYRVTANPGGANATGSSSPITVPNLTNGVSYTFTVTATNSAGEGSASAASNSVIPAAPQAITFVNPGTQNFGTTPTLTATSDAGGGYPVSFTSSTTGVCTITAGGALTFVNVGSCTINANQAGDSSFLAAPQESQTFTVAAVVPGAPTAATATAGDTQASIAFIAPVFTGGTAITGYTVTVSPADVAPVNGASSPIVVTGLTNGQAYTFTVTADNSAGTGSASAASNSITPAATQTITFNTPAAQSFGTSPTLTATSDSGLTPIFTSSTTGVCTITTGGALTFVTAGTCTINADQAGNGSYLAAIQVSRSFVVNAVIPGAPAIGVATAGDAQASVAFSAPASSGGAAISAYTVTANPGGLTGTGVASPVAVSGLTNGQPYTFTVTATNSAGTGSASGASNAVTPNGAPTISGIPATNVDQDVAYSFIPTAVDTLGDTLTFSITNKPTWASFDTATGALTGTPTSADVGTTSGIVISVSDGTLSASLPTFNLEVIATVDPLQPVVTPPTDLVINATGLFTPVSLRQLLALASNADQTQIDQLVNTMASDGVSGNSCCAAIADGLGASNTFLLKPGRHEIKWKATNAVGVTGEAIQVVNINPIVSLSKSQVTVRGSNVEFRVLLNGPSPVYPLSIPFVVDPASTATAAEYNLVSGIATFTQSGQVEVVIPVSLAAVTGFSDSQLVVALGDGINAGASNRHTIDIRQGNVPPAVNVQIAQGGINTSLVTPNGGPVTVTATVSDANVGDTHTFDWSTTSGLADTDGNPTNATRVFDPSGVTGSRQVQVNVTDSGGASVQASVYFRVISSLPILDVNTDTDQDGFSDSLEGTGDTDDNGIPDYLDNMPSTNILPQQGSTTNAYLIECDPGVRCGLGLFARSSNSGGVQVLDNELGTLDNLIVDPVFEPVGGVFDFAIRDLPTPGQSVRVVIPQRSAIPANAVYRKFQRGRWVTFITDANNAIHSAPGFTGYCPPPGSSDWTAGLTAGHLCVQLTIQDGGANDDDGLVNSAVVDPGAVSAALPVEPPVIPPVEEPKPPVKVKSQGGGAMGGFWLLLLGGLMVLKRIKPTWIALVALVATSVNSQAADSNGFYLRADIAGVVSSQEQADFSSALSAAGYKFTMDSYDTSRSGFQLALGLQWERHLYTELGYLDLGDVKVDLTLDGETDLSSFSQDFAANYPLSAEGLTLVQGIILTPDAPIKVSAEVGAFIWRSEIGVDNGVLAVDDDEGEDVLVGVKLDIPMSEQFGFGIGLRRIYFDDQEADLFSLIGTYHF